jgi:hypothetical protein
MMKTRIHSHSAGDAAAAATAALALLVLLAALAATPAAAQDAVRSWGMGGAGAASARGLGAVQANPANLAFSGGTTIGLASAALDVHNNAISLDRYNEITGSHLDAAAKERLLADIPADGLRLDADVNASALGVQSGGLALTFGAIGAGSGNLDKDYFDLVLYGNPMNESVDFSNTWGEGYALGAATLSYGAQVLDLGGARLSAGANVRFLQGIYEMHVDEAYGSLSTSMTEISGEAFLATRTAEGGQGYGLDLGVALQTAGGLTLGLAVDNVQSSITWDRNVERTEYRVTAADINLLNDGLKDAIADADTSFAGDPYETSLPRRARLGAAKSFGPLLVAADYIQGFDDRSGASTKPRFQTGIELALAGFFKPRLGVSGGGGEDPSATAGLGLKIGPWCLDVAAVSSSGLQPGQNKGVGVAVGSSLVF